MFSTAKLVRDEGVIYPSFAYTPTGSWLGRIKTGNGKFKVVTVGNRGQVYDLSVAGVWSVASLLQQKVH